MQVTAQSPMVCEPVRPPRPLSVLSEWVDPLSHSALLQQHLQCLSVSPSVWRWLLTFLILPLLSCFMFFLSSFQVCLPKKRLQPLCLCLFFPGKQPDGAVENNQNKGNIWDCMSEAYCLWRTWSLQCSPSDHVVFGRNQLVKSLRKWRVDLAGHLGCSPKLQVTLELNVANQSFHLSNSD